MTKYKLETFLINHSEVCWKQSCIFCREALLVHEGTESIQNTSRILRLRPCLIESFLPIREKVPAKKS